MTGADLDKETRQQLRTLPADLATAVARRLVAAAAEEDPERAYAHARQARRLASRVGVVRAACGAAAYRTGAWADALAELRAARRMTGGDDYLPMMADCERALGRPERALEMVRDPAIRRTDRATQIEALIVESGIRRDKGQFEAAALVLRVPELTGGAVREWSTALHYAYADALLDVGQVDGARAAFAAAAAADRAGETDAAQRLAVLGGSVPDLEDVVTDLPEVIDLADEADDDRTSPRVR